MRVLVDGVAATPGPVVYDNMMRTTSFTLGSALTSLTISCANEVDTGLNAGVVTCTPNTTSTAITGALTTVLNETGVRAFTFIVQDLRPGTHSIVVQGQFNASTTPAPSGSDSASVVVGPRTLAVEQVTVDKH